MDEKFIIQVLKGFGIKEKYIDILLSNYKAEYRKYHSLNHITELLSKFNLDIYLGQYDYLTVEDRDLLLLAIIFHDVIYNVGSKTNELESAEFFKKAVEDDTWFNPNAISSVYNLILVTRTHEPFTYYDHHCDLYKLSLIMIDLDLSGFEGEDYYQYELLVQEEFSSVFSWEEYKVGHANFLELYKNKVNSEIAKNNIDNLIKMTNEATSFSF